MLEVKTVVEVLTLVTMLVDSTCRTCRNRFRCSRHPGLHTKRGPPCCPFQSTRELLLVVTYPTVGGLSGIFLRNAPSFDLKLESDVAVFTSDGKMFHSLTA